LIEAKKLSKKFLTAFCFCVNIISSIHKKDDIIQNETNLKGGIL